MHTLDLPAEFASTYKEWHYLTVGLSVGFALGLLTKIVLET